MSKTEEHKISVTIKDKNSYIIIFESPEKFGPEDPVNPYPYSENWEGDGICKYTVLIEGNKIIKVSKDLVGNHPFISLWELDVKTGLQKNRCKKTRSLRNGQVEYIDEKLNYGNGRDPYFDFFVEELAWILLRYRIVIE